MPQSSILAKPRDYQVADTASPETNLGIRHLGPSESTSLLKACNFRSIGLFFERDSLLRPPYPLLRQENGRTHPVGYILESPEFNYKT